MSTSSPSPIEKIIFRNDQHSIIISERLLSFYEKSELFDTVLIAGSDCVNINAHRIVLSVMSEFFLEKFRGNHIASKENVVELKEIDGTTLKMVVDFMYSGWIELTIKNAESILRTAAIFKMKSLVDGCCDFFEKQTDNSNCLHWVSLSKELNLSALKDKLLEYTYNHFEEISKQKELLLLNEFELKDLLFNDNIYSNLEEYVFLSLVAWIEYDKANREHLTLKLLSMVRYQILTPNFIIKNRKSVGKTAETIELVHKWVEWHWSPETRSIDQRTNELEPRKKKLKLPDISYFNSQGTQTTSPFRFDLKPSKIDFKISDESSSTSQGFATQPTSPFPFDAKPTKVDAKLPDKGSSNSQGVGTQPTFPTAFQQTYDQQKQVSKQKKKDGKFAVITSQINGKIVIQTYNNSQVNSWTIEKEIPLWEEKFDFSMIVIDEKLFIVGGRDNDEVKKSVDCLNLHTFEWSSLPPMQERRFLSQLVEFDGDLHVCGGVFHPSTKEIYNFSTDKWKLLQKSHCCDTFAQNGILYLVSFCNNGYIKYCDNANEKWISKAMQKKSLLGFGFAAVGEFLYFIGGYEEGYPTDSVKRYNLSTDTWCEMEPLPRPRWGVKATVFENKIFVFGGNPEINWVDEYNPDAETWTSLDPLSGFLDNSFAFCTLPIKK